MPAKTTKPSEDLANPYGYTEMEWAAQLDPAYAAARAEVRRLSVGEEGILSVKVKEFVVMSILASRGLQYGVEAHMRRAIDYGATKEEFFREGFLRTDIALNDRCDHPRTRPGNRGKAAYGKTVRAVYTSGRRKGLTARPPPTLPLSHEANAAWTLLGGRVHAAARPSRTPPGPRDPGGFQRRRAAHGDRSGTQPPIIWTA